MIVAIASTVVGALSGYLFARYQAATESRARRQVLARSLLKEFEFVDPKPVAYDATKVIYRDPIHITALNHLLDGRTIDYRRHAQLIEQLLKVAATLARRNDLAIATNQAQTNVAMPDTAHRQIHDTMVERHGDFVTAISEAVPLLTALSFERSLLSPLREQIALSRRRIGL